MLKSGILVPIEDEIRSVMNFQNSEDEPGEPFSGSIYM